MSFRTSASQGELIHPLLAFLFFVFLSTYTHGQVRINEFLASNTSTNEDPDFGNTSDWIEFYNSSDQPFNLKGYYLTDNLENPDKWILEKDLIIPANGYVIVWADGESHPQHTSFKLSADGEQIGLFSPGLEPIDFITYSFQAPDISYGRNTENPDLWGYFDKPTPGLENDSAFYTDFTKSFPEFSRPGGLTDTPFDLTLWTDMGGEIRFTTDGSEPNIFSALYDSAIPIDSTTILRARIFKSGELPGPVVTHSYFINQFPSSDLPVVSISTHPDNFWDPVTGIYVQDFKPEWEVPINIELFEHGHDRAAFNEQAGTKVNGLNSWVLPQKMLGIYFRNQYGSGALEYPLFFDRSRSSFETFALRASGSDWSFTLFRDILGQLATRSNMELATMGFRTCVVYVNGQYMGIHNIRSKVEADFIEENFHMEPGSFDLIENEHLAEAGDLKEYDHLISLYSEDLSIQENFDAVAEVVDVENLTDLIITQLYVRNTSIGHNIMAWKPKNSGKWKWIVMDLDRGFFQPYTNLLDFFMNIETTPFKEMMANEEYQAYFARRLTNHLNTTFHPDLMNTYIDERRALIKDEVPNHVARWKGTTSSYGNGLNSVGSWEYEVRVVRDFVRERPQVLMADLENRGLISTATLGIGIYPEGAGKVKLNGQEITGNQLSGKYIKNADFELSAHPNPGYSFLGWSNPDPSFLIPRGSNWKYWDSGTDPGSNWVQPGFDDTGWKAGPAQLGYGEGDESTTLDWGSNSSNKPITNYFRHSFDVSATEKSTGYFILKLLKDDGAVVYLNGTEILRSNMKVGAIGLQQTAKSNVSQELEGSFFIYTLDREYLVTGTNVLAVEVHQDDAASTDVSFDLELTSYLPDEGNLISTAKDYQKNLTEDHFLVAIYGTTDECLIPAVLTQDLTLTKECSPYLASGTTLIPENITLTIEPGVEILMPENAHLMVNGSIHAQGTEAERVLFRINPEYGTADWGAMVLMNASAPSVLNYVTIEDASDGPVPIRDKGAISVFNSTLSMDHLVIEDVEKNPIFAQYSDVLLQNSSLHSKVTGDLINVKYGTASVINCDFRGNDQPDTDGIDYDEVIDGVIESCTFYNFFGSNSDAIDIGEAAKNIVIDSVIAYNITDKGVSIGQRSTASISNSLIMNCNLGVAVKDSARVSVNQCTFYNATQAVSCYEKNPGRAGGNAFVTNSILSNSSTGSYYLDDRSSLGITYSLSDASILPDHPSNLFGDPLFKNPTFHDFEIQSESPAFQSGYRGGSQINMGAPPFDLDIAPEILIVEINTDVLNSARPEYIALFNPSDQAVDVSGYQVTKGFTHTIQEGTILDPGDTLFLTSSSNLFWWSGKNVQKWTEGKLSNNGESVELVNQYGIVIDHIDYLEKDWPSVVPDEGVTFSLKSSMVDNHFGKNWQAVPDLRPVGIKSSINSTRVYPNPVIGKLTVLSENNKNAFVWIYDMAGKLLDQKKLDETGWLVLDYSKYPPGLHVLKIGSETKRVLHLSY